MLPVPATDRLTSPPEPALQTGRGAHTPIPAGPRGPGAEGAQSQGTEEPSVQSVLLRPRAQVRVKPGARPDSSDVLSAPPLLGQRGPCLLGLQCPRETVTRAALTRMQSPRVQVTADRRGSYERSRGLCRGQQA